MAETLNVPILDAIIKEAAERNELAGLLIRVPAADATVEGQLAQYKGVKIQATTRITSWTMTEVAHEKVEPVGK